MGSSTANVQCPVAAGQTAASRKRGGKSELRRAVRRVTPGQGNLKDSGTENIPPAGAARRRRVRVKRCGKSAPRRPQGRWQAKPRTEQDQIGRHASSPDAQCVGK